MNPEQIQKLLSLGEGQRVEFKSTIKNVDALGRVICGLLNTSGGYLICGVKDQGTVLGIDASAEIVAALEKQLHDGLAPKALVELAVETLEDKPILVIEVPAGQDVPYAFRNTIYIRSGESTQPADPETIRDIVLRRQTEPERWERRFSLADLENDVDADQVRDSRARPRRKFAAPSSVTPGIHRWCSKICAVAKHGRLTNGGDVLFAHNPAARFPQTRVRAMRYNSDKAGDTYRDMKSFEGPLQEVFEDAYGFVIRNTPTRARFKPGQIKREDSPLYPEDAVREAPHQCARPSRLQFALGRRQHPHLPETP